MPQHKESIGLRLLHRTIGKLPTTSESEIFYSRSGESFDNLDGAKRKSHAWKVRRMLRRLSDYLVVLALGTVVHTPVANATSRNLDFYVSVPNTTGHPIEFCNVHLTSCEIIPAGRDFFDAHDTSGHALDYIRRWVAVLVVKDMGKIVPLELLIDPPILRRKSNGAFEFQIIFSKEKYTKEFGGEG